MHTHVPTIPPRFLFAALLLLGLGACSSGNDVGNSCDVDEDCRTGTCYVGPGGGYCTTPCETEGDTAACPTDTVCKPIQGGARRCLLVCGSQSSCGHSSCPDGHCPSGSSCVSVGNTQLRACEPSPG
jgi:hypothetical protein